ncbi:MAG: DUF975 family protein [Clostridia bacterium]|nr:DUF975 family protein [Clostridia bacterium]
MKNKEIRAHARDAYHDNWGKYLGLNFMYFLIIFAMVFLAFIPIVGSIAVMICSIPLAYGYMVNMVKLKKGETTKFTEFFSLGFGNFGRAWAIYGWTLVKLLLIFLLYFVGVFVIAFLPILAVITKNTVIVLGASVIAVIGIVVLYVFLIAKAMLYVLAQMVAVYNPEKLPKDCVEHSAKLMKGNRLKYIGLGLSFFGWMILCSLSFGMGYVFLLPYISLAVLCFYESLDKENLDKTKKPAIMDWDDVNAAMDKKEEVATSVVENN